MGPRQQVSQAGRQLAVARYVADETADAYTWFRVRIATTNPLLIRHPMHSPTDALAAGVMFLQQLISCLTVGRLQMHPGAVVVP